ncbi:T9SS type A sorting domain-containing protein [Chryseolinea sp. T2]|uniref:T9SS type A sorting domain-containing protein n=1 Tax=Chryseolinea sp. T2 TaxID=3129255 RepID=UPI003076AED2
MKRILPKVAGLLNFLLLSTSSLIGQVSLVKDINSHPAQFTAINVYNDIFCNCGDKLFFSRNTEKGGELWRTDGTESGTVLVKDIYKGFGDGVRGPLFCNGTGRVFFMGEDALSGRELWVSDGTENGTRLVKDVTPGTGRAADILGLWGTDMYFLADHDSDNQMEIWKSDGSPSGTTLVTTVGFTGHSFPYATGFSDTHIFFEIFREGQNNFELWAFNIAGNTTEKLLENGWVNDPTNFGDKILFGAVDQTTFTQALWLSDGTSGGTIKVKDFGASYVQSLIKYGDNVIFTSGGSTWVTDGTDAGTSMIAGGSVNASVVVDGDFYGLGFESSTNSSRLLKYDGTSVETINMGGASGDILGFDQIPILDGKLILQYYNSTVGTEIGISDDTRQNITLLKDINPGVANSAPRSWVNFNNRLYFVANDVTNGSQIWSTDGTEAGTLMLTHPKSTGNAFVERASLVVSDNKLHFLASSIEGTPSGSGPDLYTTDGTELGTLMKYDFEDGGLYYLGRTDNDLIYLSQRKMYKTNGTSPSVTIVKDLSNELFGISTGGPNYTLGSELIFALLDYSSPTNYGYEFWVTDGTDGGTHLLKDIYSGANNGVSGKGIVMGSKLIFDGIDAGSGSELWVTDGTAAGTQLLKDINSGVADSKPADFTVLNDKVLFSATTSDSGREIWITDGTAAGTHLLIDLVPGEAGSDAKDLISLGNLVLFTAFDDTNGWALWKTDGTEAGTVMVKDILPAHDRLRFPTNMTAVGSRLYFSADDDVHGNELWISDGTSDGTIVIDILNGDESSYPSKFTALKNGVVYFEANDELWRTNGTFSSTSRVSELEPLEMISLENVLYFVAPHPDYSVELFKAEFTKFDQQLIVTPVANKTLGDAPFKIEASSSSALPVTITSESELAIQNNTATIVKAGTVKISIQQYGDDVFNSAESSLTLCILPAKPTISITGLEIGEPVLTSNASSGNQWYKEESALATETSQTFEPSEDGAYKLTVSVDGCMSTFSDEAAVIIMGVESPGDGVSLFPNPVRETLRIETGDIGTVSITITDVSGSAIRSYDLGRNETVNYSLAGYPAGVYIVRIVTEQGVSYKKIIKDY